MDYQKISKETMTNLYLGYKSLENSPLKQDLRALIELYVSQINDYRHCYIIHKNDALTLNVSEEKINSLSEFEKSDLFSASEKAALTWAESLTKLNGNRRVESTDLHKYFDEKEIVDITISISLMNAFNRLAMSMM
jgi:AhpD family alkylhydroperoxidase